MFFMTKKEQAKVFEILDVKFASCNQLSTASTQNVSQVIWYSESLNIPSPDFPQIVFCRDVYMAFYSRLILG